LELKQTGNEERDLNSNSWQQQGLNGIDELQSHKYICHDNENLQGLTIWQFIITATIKGTIQTWNWIQRKILCILIYGS